MGAAAYVMNKKNNPINKSIKNTLSSPFAILTMRFLLCRIYISSLRFKLNIIRNVLKIFLKCLTNM